VTRPVAADGVTVAVIVTAAPYVDGFGELKSETALVVCATSGCDKVIRKSTCRNARFGITRELAGRSISGKGI
jgi:hypothetical protein